MLHLPARYRPPAPIPRNMFSGQGGDFLQKLSTSQYRRDFMAFEQGGVPTVIVNKPAAIKDVLSRPIELFPKSDLMVEAFEKLFGDGLLISNGAAWHRQRAILEPAFAAMRVRRIYPLIFQAIANFRQRLLAMGSGAEISLESEMSYFAIDVILRTIFSEAVSEQEAHNVFGAYLEYQEHASGSMSATHFGGEAGDPTLSEAALVKSSERLREFVGRLVDERLASSHTKYDDVLQAVLDAQAGLNGGGFTRDELVDQLVVLFVAGHEPMASALTWSLFILSQQPEQIDKIRHEVERVAGDDPLEFNDIDKLVVARNVFREVLRLYPTAAFITRLSLEATTIDGHDVAAGTIIVISPWLVHRHLKYWKDPDIFDPDRFSKEREREIVPGAYIPFGHGARACIGRIVAMTEGPLLLAELSKAVRVVPVAPEDVMPTYRLTVRPKGAVRCRIEPV